MLSSAAAAHSRHTLPRRAIVTGVDRVSEMDRAARILATRYERVTVLYPLAAGRDVEELAVGPGISCLGIEGDPSDHDFWNRAIRASEETIGEYDVWLDFAAAVPSEAAASYGN